MEVQRRPNVWWKLPVLLFWWACYVLREVSGLQEFTEPLCNLPLDVTETAALLGGVVPDFLANVTDSPTLKVGMLPHTASILFATTLQLAIQDYLGYPAVDLVLTGVQSAPSDLASGRIHVMLDFWPAEHFSSPQQYAEFSANEDVIHLGSGGLQRRPGVYVSQTLALRIMRSLPPSNSSETLGKRQLFELSWEQFSSLFEEFSVNRHVIPDAVGGNVFVLGDAVVPGGWETMFTQYCDGDQQSSSRRFKPFADVSINISCSIIETGEDGMRLAMDTQSCIHGHNDAIVILPTEFSDLAFEPYYGLQRLSLRRYEPECFQSGKCDWPRDVVQKFVWRGVQSFFAEEILAFLEAYTIPESLFREALTALQHASSEILHYYADGPCRGGAQRTLDLGRTLSDAILGPQRLGVRDSGAAATLLAQTVSNSAVALHHARYMRAPAQQEPRTLEEIPSASFSSSPSETPSMLAPSPSLTPLPAWSAPFIDFELVNVAAGPDDGMGDASMSTLIFWNDGTIPNDLPSYSSIRRSNGGAPLGIEADSLSMLFDAFSLDFNNSLPTDTSRGDYRRYVGGEIRILASNAVILRATSCMLSVTVTYPGSASGSFGQITCIVDEQSSNSLMVSYYGMPSTAFPSNSPSLSVTSSITASSSVLASASPSISDTSSQTVSATLASSFSATAMSTGSQSRFASSTPETTPSVSSSRTVSATMSLTNSPSQTTSSSSTASPTVTPTLTIEASDSPTASRTPSSTSTSSETQTPTASTSMTISRSSTKTGTTTPSATVPATYTLLTLEIFRWQYVQPKEYDPDAYSNAQPSQSNVPQNVRLLRASQDRKLQVSASGLPSPTLSATPSISPFFRASPSLPVLRFGTVDMWVRLSAPASATPTPTQSATGLPAVSASPTTQAGSVSITPVPTVDPIFLLQATDAIRQASACSLLNSSLGDIRTQVVGHLMRVNNIVPSVGNVLGGDLVLIKGSGFGQSAPEALAVLINRQHCASAAWIDDFTVTCITSAGWGSYLNVTVIAGTRSVTAPGLFSYEPQAVHDIASITMETNNTGGITGIFPPSIAVSESALLSISSSPFDTSRTLPTEVMVVIRGSFFYPSNDLTCRFFTGENDLFAKSNNGPGSVNPPNDNLSAQGNKKHTTSVAASYINSTAILCAAPFSRTGLLTVSVSNDGHTWSSGFALARSSVVYPYTQSLQTSVARYLVLNTTFGAPSLGMYNASVVRSVEALSNSYVIPESALPADLGPADAPQHVTIVVLHALTVLNMSALEARADFRSAYVQFPGVANFLQSVLTEVAAINATATWIQRTINSDITVLRYSRVHIQHVFWPSCAQARDMIVVEGTTKAALELLTVCTTMQNAGGPSATPWMAGDMTDEAMAFIAAVLLRNVTMQANTERRRVIAVVGPYPYDRVISALATLPREITNAATFPCKIVDSGRVLRAGATALSLAYWARQGMTSQVDLQYNFYFRAAEVVQFKNDVAAIMDVPLIAFQVGTGGKNTTNPSDNVRFPSMLRLTPPDTSQGAALAALLIQFEDDLVAKGLLSLDLLNQLPSDLYYVSVPNISLASVQAFGTEISNSSASALGARKFPINPKVLSDVAIPGAWLHALQPVGSSVCVVFVVGNGHPASSWKDATSGFNSFTTGDHSRSQNAVDVLVGFLASWTGIGTDQLFKDIGDPSVASSNPGTFHSLDSTLGLSIPKGVVGPDRIPVRIIVIPQSVSTVEGIMEIFAVTVGLGSGGNFSMSQRAILLLSPLTRINAVFLAAQAIGLTKVGARAGYLWLGSDTFSRYLEDVVVPWQQPFAYTTRFEAKSSGWVNSGAGEQFGYTDLLGEFQELSAACTLRDSVVDAVVALVQPFEEMLETARSGLVETFDRGSIFIDLLRSYQHADSHLSVSSHLKPISAYGQGGWISSRNIASDILDEVAARGGAVLRDDSINTASDASVRSKVNDPVSDYVTVLKHDFNPDTRIVTERDFGDASAAFGYTNIGTSVNAVLTYNHTGAAFGVFGLGRAGTLPPPAFLPAIPSTQSSFQVPANIVIAVMLPMAEAVYVGDDVSAVDHGVEPGLLAAIELAVSALNESPNILMATRLHAVVVPVKIRYRRFVITASGRGRMLRDRDLSKMLVADLSTLFSDPDFDQDHYVSIIQDIANQVYLTTGGQLSRDNIVAMVGMDESVRTATLLAALQDSRSSAALATTATVTGASTSSPLSTWAYGAHAMQLSQANATITHVTKRTAELGSRSVSLSSFLRLSPGDYLGVPALINLLQSYDWQRIGTITVSQDDFASCEEKLVLSSLTVGINISTSHRIVLDGDQLRLNSSEQADISLYHKGNESGSIASKLLPLQTDEVMVVFVAVAPAYVCAVLRGIRAAGLYGPKHLLLGLQSFMADDDVCLGAEDRAEVDEVVRGSLGVASAASFVPASEFLNAQLYPTTLASASSDNFVKRVLEIATKQRLRPYNATDWKSAGLLGSLDAFSGVSMAHAALLGVDVAAFNVMNTSAPQFDSQSIPYAAVNLLSSNSTNFDAASLLLSPHIASLYDCVFAAGLAAHLSISKGLEVGVGATQTDNLLRMMRDTEHSNAEPLAEGDAAKLASAVSAAFEGATGPVSFQRDLSDLVNPRLFVVNRRSHMDLAQTLSQIEGRRLATDTNYDTNTSELVIVGRYDGVPSLSITGCAPGYYQTSSLTCQACPIDTYKTVFGNGACSACPAQGEFKTTTNGVVGAIRIGQCLCPQGYYITPLAESTGSFTEFPCLPCPTSAKCEGLGLTLSTIQNQRGYWRGSNSTASFDACFSADACALSGIVEVRALTADSSLTNYSSTPCNTGYEGPLCQMCSKGFGKRGTTCAKCPSVASIGVAWLFGVSLAVWMALYLMRNSLTIAYGTQVTKRRSQNVRAFLNYLQINAAIALLRASNDTNASGVWSFQGAVSSVSLAFTAWDCILDARAFPIALQKFVLYMALPVLFVLICVLVTLVSGYVRTSKSPDETGSGKSPASAPLADGAIVAKGSPKDEEAASWNKEMHILENKGLRASLTSFSIREWFLSAYFAVSFLVYPTLIGSVVDVLFCYTLPSQADGKISFLKADFSVHCSSNAAFGVSDSVGVVHPHHSFVLAGKALAFLYIVGIPVTYLIMLLLHRHALFLGQGRALIHPQRAGELCAMIQKRIFDAQDWNSQVARCRTTTAPQQLRLQMRKLLTRAITLREVVRRLQVLTKLFKNAPKVARRLSHFDAPPRVDSSAHESKVSETGATTDATPQLPWLQSLERKKEAAVRAGEAGSVLTYLNSVGQPDSADSPSYDLSQLNEIGNSHYKDDYDRAVVASFMMEVIQKRRQTQQAQANAAAATASRKAKAAAGALNIVDRFENQRQDQERKRAALKQVVAEAYKTFQQGPTQATLLAAYVQKILFSRSMQTLFAWNYANQSSNPNATPSSGFWDTWFSDSRDTHEAAAGREKIPALPTMAPPKPPTPASRSLSCWDVLMRIIEQVLAILLCKPRGASARAKLREPTPMFVSYNITALRELFDKIELGPAPTDIPSKLSKTKSEREELLRQKFREILDAANAEADGVQGAVIEGRRGSVRRSSVYAGARRLSNAQSRRLSNLASASGKRASTSKSPTHLLDQPIAASLTGTAADPREQRVRFDVTPGLIPAAHLPHEPRSTAVNAVLYIYTGRSYEQLFARWAGRDKESTETTLKTRFRTESPLDIFSFTSGALTAAVSHVENEPWVAEMMQRSCLLQLAFEECVVLIATYGYTATEALAAVQKWLPDVVLNQKRYGFLYSDYSPGQPYFEVWNMLRKASLVIATSLLGGSDSFIQLGVCLLLLSVILMVSYWFSPYHDVFIGANPWQPACAYRAGTVRDTSRGWALSRLDISIQAENDGQQGIESLGKLSRFARSDGQPDGESNEYQDPRPVILASRSTTRESLVNPATQTSWKWMDMLYVENWGRALPDLIPTSSLDLLALFVCVFNIVIFIIIQQLKSEQYNRIKLETGNAATAAAAAAGLATTAQSAAAAAADTQSISTFATETLEAFVIGYNLCLMFAFVAVIAADVRQERKMEQHHIEAVYRQTPEALAADESLYRGITSVTKIPLKARLLRSVSACMKRCRCKCRRVTGSVTVPTEDLDGGDREAPPLVAEESAEVEENQSFVCTSHENTFPVEGDENTGRAVPQASTEATQPRAIPFAPPSLGSAGAGMSMPAAPVSPAVGPTLQGIATTAHHSANTSNRPLAAPLSLRVGPLMSGPAAMSHDVPPVARTNERTPVATNPPIVDTLVETDPEILAESDVDNDSVTSGVSLTGAEVDV